MTFYLGWIILLMNLPYLKASCGPQPPHIILIFADDLGWNDVSYHGSPEIPTPNIDALALNGISLENYYGEWICTPSRAAILTGKYPMRLGLQHSVILGGEASHLPLNEITMSQYLKQIGYETHMIGKWHLGYDRKKYTPTYRGFDSFYGYWNGYLDYYNHTYLEEHTASGKPFYGLDYHDGLFPVKNKRGVYSTYDFTHRAEEIIRNHDTSKPLFLYFAQMAVHSGNSYDFEQAPADVVSQFEYISNTNRRKHAATAKVMDESVGRVFYALHKKGMLENAVFLFVSDNGGEIDPKHGGFGSNYPLRSKKWTPWEGGIHVPAIIWSPLLNLDKPRISHHLMHVTDWLPTLYSAAGGYPADLGKIDGKDMWEALINDAPSPRTEMLQNLDSKSGVSALRKGDLKLVNGTADKGYYYWYGPSGLEDLCDQATYDWVFKDGSIVRDVLMETGRWIVKYPNSVYEALHLSCEQPPPKEAFKCDTTKKPCLFNITSDPCEYHDIADQYPETVKEMMASILKYKSQEMKPQAKKPDPSANPKCHNFQYVPWLDPDQKRNCNN